MTQPHRARPQRCPRNHTCPSPTHHDTARAYWAGCRSRTATTAVAHHARTRTNHLTPVTGTARRLQALGALGHSANTIGAHLHCTGALIYRLRAARHPTCWTTTATRINTLFTELAEAGPATTRGAERTRRHAQRHTWHPPEAWDGADIDDPTAQPWTTPRTTPALDADVALLIELRNTTAQIAHRLGVTTRTIDRARARLASRQEQENAA